MCVKTDVFKKNLAYQSFFTLNAVSLKFYPFQSILFFPQNSEHKLYTDWTRILDY